MKTKNFDKANSHNPKEERDMKKNNKTSVTASPACEKGTFTIDHLCDGSAVSFGVDAFASPRACRLLGYLYQVCGCRMHAKEFLDGLCYVASKLISDGCLPNQMDEPVPMPEFADVPALIAALDDAFPALRVREFVSNYLQWHGDSFKLYVPPAEKYSDVARVAAFWWERQLSSWLYDVSPATLDGVLGCMVQHRKEIDEAYAKAVDGFASMVDEGLKSGVRVYDAANSCPADLLGQLTNDLASILGAGSSPEVYSQVSGAIRVSPSNVQGRFVYERSKCCTWEQIFPPVDESVNPLKQTLQVDAGDARWVSPVSSESIRSLPVFCL